LGVGGACLVALLPTVAVAGQQASLAPAVPASESLAGASAEEQPEADRSKEETNEVGRNPFGEEWAGLSLGWDLRLEGLSLFKHYTVGADEAWFSGEGVGGAVSMSLHFRPPAALAHGSVLRWTEFELGAGNATHYVTWKEGEGERSRTDFVQNATSAIIGVHFATGRWSSESGAPWSGMVVGLAWLPTYVYFYGGDAFESVGRINPAGLRFTVDWGRVTPTNKGLVPGIRASITWLPYVGNLPTALAIGVGCVFY